jgi:hypothetical protein
MSDAIHAAQRLANQLIEFMDSLADWKVTNDDVMFRVAREKYRAEVERAAAAGIEPSNGWHTVATWTEEGPERIKLFSHALRLAAKEGVDFPPATDRDRRSREHLLADSLYQIGRVHLVEGSRAVAKDFFERALPHARNAANITDKDEAIVPLDDQLEGKISGELLLLDAQG